VTPPPRGSRASLAATAFAVSASLAVMAVYVARAASLVAYPWDWSPDEGLYLDWARRVLQAPGTLYDPASVVPFPAVYGPLLPVLHAPLVALGGPPLLAPRLLSLAVALAGGFAIFLLVRRRDAPLALALATAALALSPLDVSFWHMLVRVDGLMLTLWLFAAVVLLPHRLERGGDRLTTQRILLGAVLLILAGLTKAMAAVHAAPLVLGWLLVDLRSAVRLAVVLGAGTLATLGILQWVTGGGFLFASALWGVHSSQPGNASFIVLHFTRLVWPILALAAVAAAAAARTSRREAGRDPALLLLLGGLLVLPATAKHGASWNYLLPALAAVAVLSGRWWAGSRLSLPRLALPAPLTGAVATAALALALAATRTFPLPTGEDARTAAAFYGYVTSHVRRVGGPILVSRPEMAYFLVGQPSDVEGSSFYDVARAGIQGSERVLERLKRGEYTMIAAMWPLPDFGGYTEALRDSYTLTGACQLRYYFGIMKANLAARRDLARPLRPPPGTRCTTAASSGRTRSRADAPPPPENAAD
jgi:hypothetical protein